MFNRQTWLPAITPLFTSRWCRETDGQTLHTYQTGSRIPEMPSLNSCKEAASIVKDIFFLAVHCGIQVMNWCLAQSLESSISKGYPSLTELSSQYGLHHQCTSDIVASSTQQQPLIRTELDWCNSVCCLFIQLTWSQLYRNYIFLFFLWDSWTQKENLCRNVKQSKRMSSHS